MTNREPGWLGCFGVTVAWVVVMIVNVLLWAAIVWGVVWMLRWLDVIA